MAFQKWVCTCLFCDITCECMKHIQLYSRIYPRALFWWWHSTLTEFPGLSLPLGAQPYLECQWRESKYLLQKSEQSSSHSLHKDLWSIYVIVNSYHNAVYIYIIYIYIYTFLLYVAESIRSHWGRFERFILHIFDAFFIYISRIVSKSVCQRVD